MRTTRRFSGFTLVELLIVIVVIAILAAITIVAYNGVQTRAHASVLQNDAAEAAQQLEAYNVTNGNYPTDSSVLRPSGGTTFSYMPVSAPPIDYCLTATNGTLSYWVSKINATPQSGSCTVNLEVNPGFEGSSDFASYVATGAASGGRSTVSPLQGSSTFRFACGSGGACGAGGIYTGANLRNSVLAGQTYTVSGYVRSSVATTMHAGLSWYTAANSIVESDTGATISVPANTWTRLTATQVAPAGAAIAKPTFYGDSWPASSYVDLDEVMLSPGSTVSGYGDGTSTGWRWVGDPNASASIGPAS